MENAAADIVQELKKRGSFLMPPADKSEIRRISDYLHMCGYGRIPDDYAGLLEKADGIQGPGFILYGTRPQSFAGGQLIEDLFMKTDEALDKSTISEGLMLGEAQGYTVIAYSTENKEYRILDGLTQDVLYRYKNIEDFIIERVKLRDRILNKKNRY